MVFNMLPTYANGTLAATIGRTRGFKEIMQRKIFFFNGISYFIDYYFTGEYFDHDSGRNVVFSVLYLT